MFFVQVEGDHPDLTLLPEVSPDGITWIRRGEPRVLSSAEAIAEVPLANSGNWLRLTVTGATVASGARILIHVNLKC